MLLLRVLCSAALVAQALATIDISAVLARTPLCAQICSVTVLGDAKCPLQEADTCLCTNLDLVKTLAVCVLANCNVTDQYAATAVRQDMCKGTPEESRTKDITDSFIILAATTFPIVILRFISRWKIAKKIWWDDWTILVASAFLVATTVVPFLHSNEGFGRHFWDVRPERVVGLRQTYYAVQMTYCIVLTLAKESILFLYLRIFTDDYFRRIVKISMIAMVAHGIIFLFCIAFQCVPVRAVWTLEPARCLDMQAMIYSGAGLSIFEDFFIMLLPILELRKLRLSRRKKIGVVFMFALGSFAAFTSIIRLRFIAKYGRSVDITWDNVDVFLWSHIEIYTAVICASVICIRPLVNIAYSAISGKVCDVLGISRVTETLPTSQKSTLPSRPWSGAFTGKLTSSKNGGHVRLDSDKDQEDIMKPQPPAKDKPIMKVWIKSEASVDSESIQMNRMDTSSENLTSNFRGRSVVEVSPTLSTHLPRTDWKRGPSTNRDPEK